MDQLEHAKQHLEEQKAAFDYIKHISTLAASIIIISIAFAQDLARQPSARWLMLPAFGGQLICILSLNIAAIGVIGSGRMGNPATESVVRFTILAVVIGLAGFLAGIVSMGIFLIVNTL